MEPDHAAAEAAAAPPRTNPKLLILGAGAAGLLLLVVTLVLWWCWPPGAPAKKPRRVAVVASVAASSAAPASAAGPPAAVAALAAASASAPAVPALAAGPELPAAALVPATVPPAEELPLDRLQRRLAEVLGASVTIDAARPGELRVLKHRDAAAPQASAAMQPSLAGRAWSYSGLTGPRAWARLDPRYSACASGRQQSPIDLRGSVAAPLQPVHFDYRPGRFEVLDAGHTVQADAPPGNAIELDGKRYELQQLHFHRPSEERIDGRQFEMDVHLVHRDAAGRLAVVAVLLRRGAAQPLLQALWQQLASAAADGGTALAEIDPNQLLPQDRRYYSYIGSLTTPPCTEGVLWLVLRQPLTVSAQQIDDFAQRYPTNARPLQPAAGRVIRQSM